MPNRKRKIDFRNKIIKIGTILLIKIQNDDLSFDQEIYDFYCENSKWIHFKDFEIPKNYNIILMNLLFLYSKRTISYYSDIKKFLNIPDNATDNTIRSIIYDFVMKSHNISKTCHNNKTKKFRNFEIGYDTCGNFKNCKCAWEKAQKTFTEKYGVDNPFKTLDFIDKRKETNLEKYGTEHHMQSDMGYNNWKNSMIEIHGVSHPYHMDNHQEKIKNTNLERYGETHANKTQDYKNKSKKNNLEKYGVEHSSQKHYTEELKNILFDKEKLKEVLKCLTPTDISKKYNIHQSTIFDYIKKYNIDYDFSSSSYEYVIKCFLQENNINFLQNARSIIAPLELDFYLPDYNLAIEFNGLYWHSHKNVDNNYHLNKYIACKEKGIRLIMIQEDEWIEKSDLIKGKLLNIFSKSIRGLPARKLSINCISNNIGNKFCEQYHIQGGTGQIIYSIGAYDNFNNLVGVMLFNKQRNTGDIELIRFCTDGKIHAGLFSKMLKFTYKNTDYNKIISFADLRYSDGNLYEKTGFKQQYITPPDYMYIVENKRIHKSNFSKSTMKRKKLFHEDYINSNTESTLTKELGLYKIYDIGKIKYFITKDVIIK